MVTAGPPPVHPPSVPDAGPPLAPRAALTAVPLLVTGVPAAGFAASGLAPMLGGGRADATGLVLAVLAAAFGGMALRANAPLRRRRLHIDATGIRAVGWPEPLDLPAHRVTGAAVRAPDGHGRAGHALVVGTAAGRAELDLAAFDASAVADRLLRVGVPTGGLDAAGSGPSGAPAVAVPARTVVLRPRVLRTVLAVTVPAAVAVFLVVAGGGAIVAAVAGRIALSVPELALAVLLGLAGLAVLASAARLLGRLDPRRRVTADPAGLELVVPSQRDRPVRIPWSSIATVGLQRRGRHPARLLVTLRHRPADAVVLELLETAPGRVRYPLDGFDPDPVESLVRDVTDSGYRPG